MRPAVSVYLKAKRRKKCHGLGNEKGQEKAKWSVKQAEAQEGEDLRNRDMNEEDYP